MRGRKEFLPHPASQTLKLSWQVPELQTHGPQMSQAHLTRAGQSWSQPLRKRPSLGAAEIPPGCLQTGVSECVTTMHLVFHTIHSYTYLSAHVYACTYIHISIHTYAYICINLCAYTHISA